MGFQPMPSTGKTWRNERKAVSRAKPRRRERMSRWTAEGLQRPIQMHGLEAHATFPFPVRKILVKIASPSEEPSGTPILLFRPINAVQLAKAFEKRPYQVIMELMHLDHFVSLRDEIGDDCLADYAQSQGFFYRILDRR